METQTISFTYLGHPLFGDVKLLCPIAQIFLVTIEGMAPFHLEYNEIGWEAIEEGIDSDLVNGLGSELMERFRSSIFRTVEPNGEYFLVEREGEEMICFWNNDLRIRVVDSTEKLPLGDSSEQIYFGSFDGDFRAFQTIDYQGEDVTVIQDAIEWYTCRVSDSVSKVAFCKNAPSLN